MAIFSRILVAIDDSPAADHALDLSIKLAVATGGEPGTVIVCHAVELSLAVSVTDPSADPASIAPIDAYRHETQAILDRAVARVAAAGGRAEAVIADGRAVDAILQLAADRKVEAIAMGSHGRRGVARLILGSTAEGVLHRADVPVVVVRDPHVDGSPQR